MKLHVLCPLVICNFFDGALISQSEVKSLEVEWLYNSFQCILILRAWYASETFFVNTAIQKKKNKQDCILSSGCILWPRLSLLLHPCLSVALHQPSLCMCSQENSVLNLLKDWGLRELPNRHLFFFSTRKWWFYHSQGSHSPSLICFSSLWESPYQRGQKWF